jgi:hypothetical protein
MKATQVNVGDDLAVAIGDRSARLSPGEAFRLAERLIRQATVRMIVEETARSDRRARGREHCVVTN